MFEKLPTPTDNCTQQPLVLLVEDDYDQRSLFKFFFQKLNMNVVTAESAEEAKEILSELHFDLVICDINMPQIDGTEFIAQLRRSGNQEKLPVLCFSADPNHHEETILQTGANAYCLKTERTRLARTAEQLVTAARSTSLMPEVYRRFQ